MSNEFEKFIQNNRESFDNQLPDPSVLERIQNQLAVKPKRKGVFIPASVIRWVAACLLLAGAGTFLLLQKEPVKNNIAETPVKTDTVPAALPETQMAETTRPEVIEQEPITVHKTRPQYTAYEASVNNRQVMFARLNDNESAGQRILGAEQANKLRDTDRDVIDALVKIMNSDPNTNVRLAALEALSQSYRVTYIKQQLISSLKIQKDPMVQIGLIQLLTGMKETIILNELEKIANDDDALKEVRDEAYSSIFLLKS